MARETFLAVVAFKLGFSSYGLGDTELATGPSSKNTERKGIYRDNVLLGFIYPAGICEVCTLLVGTILGTWNTSYKQKIIALV